MYLPEVIGYRNTRRTFLGQSLTGMGAAALAALLGQSATNAATDEESARGVLQTLHFPPKAKRVIWLCMAGGMSHLETFDSKPKLAEMHEQPMPESYTQEIGRAHV